MSAVSRPSSSRLGPIPVNSDLECHRSRTGAGADRTTRRRAPASACTGTRTTRVKSRVGKVIGRGLRAAASEGGASVVAVAEPRVQHVGDRGRHVERARVRSAHPAAGLARALDDERNRADAPRRCRPARGGASRPRSATGSRDRRYHDQRVVVHALVASAAARDGRAGGRCSRAEAGSAARCGGSGTRRRSRARSTCPEAGRAPLGLVRAPDGRWIQGPCAAAAGASSRRRAGRL